MRAAVIATLTLLAALAVSGCLAPLGGVGSIGTPHDAVGAEESGDGATDPHGQASVAGSGEDGPDWDVGPLSDVEVVEVGPHHVRLAYRVRGDHVGPHRVGAVAEETGRPWSWTDSVNGSGRHEVRLEWLHANTTHRFNVRLEDGDGGVLTEVNGTFRTEPVPYGWADPAKAVVRPGGQLLGGHGRQTWGCTVGFILTDASNSTVYALTAGHCLRRAEVVVHDVDIRFAPPYWQPNWGLDDVLPWTPYNETSGGIVEHWEIPGDSNDPDALDWGLVRILPQLRAAVSPTMVHWTGPTGIVAHGTVEARADVCYFGQAGSSPPPMRDRCGHFLTEDSLMLVPRDGFYTMQVPASWYGDSGSPVIDHASGRALGLVTHALGNVAAGPMLDAILERAALAGYDLRLATAPYDPPMALPVGDGGLP